MGVAALLFLVGIAVEVARVEEIYRRTGGPSSPPSSSSSSRIGVKAGQEHHAP